MSICDRAASQAQAPGNIRTLRNKPSLCALRNARSERPICSDVLCGKFRAHNFWSLAAAA